MKRIGTRAYIKTLIKDPNVASITPTSNFGVRKLLSTVNFSEAKLFVEYGPGGGVITKYLLSKMSSDARLIAIEQNPQFAKALSNAIHDPRCEIVNDSAENVVQIIDSLISKGFLAPGQNRPDHIISGIPFSLFPTELKNKILYTTQKTLKKEGSFLVYQFLISLSAGKNDIKRKIREYFEIARSGVELRNVPPLRIFEGLPKVSVDPCLKSKKKLNKEHFEKSEMLNN